MLSIVHVCNFLHILQYAELENTLFTDALDQDSSIAMTSV